MLAQHLDVDEATLAVDGDQQVHRRAFEAGYRCQVDRLEHIAYRPGLRFEFAGDRPHWQVGQLGLYVQRRLEAAGEIVVAEIAGQCRAAQTGRKQQGAAGKRAEGRTGDRGHEDGPSGTTGQTDRMLVLAYPADTHANRTQLDACHGKCPNKRHS
ncbi:MAG: hypothetical protein NVV69_14190 [Methyloversatilis sp.]|uniref:hypothetical protein n=1 Tax=Methyloversatilis sp. TaxID=2569862 RepID=UPI0025ED11B3|nr:hypothetical protein [Methyloversatilis sp.]MCR6667124.1 hypothetical protein [Methyloversatilis sp.]